MNKKLIWSYSKIFKKRLLTMFYYYKNLYNLKTKIEFTNYISDSFYELETDKIRAFIPLKYQNLHLMSIETLLHELHHAINYKYNKVKFISQINQAGSVGLFGLFEKHDKLHFEQLAQRFTKQEKKKWIRQ